jgi:hypothetical protein
MLGRGPWSDRLTVVPQIARISSSSEDGTICAESVGATDSGWWSEAKLAFAFRKARGVCAARRAAAVEVSAREE